MNELSSLRTETGKVFELDPKLKAGQYCLEVRTGPIHYKESYKDTDPWLDLDETYSEPSEIKGIGKVLVYPKMPNIVTVYQDRCGYQIQSRSNPDHIATVELVSIDGQEVTTWQKTAALNMYAKVHPFRVGVWKDFSGASRAKSTTMRWKITEQGRPDQDSHPFFFRESPQAFTTANLTDLSPSALDVAKATIETARTHIDDRSWYWDEIIPPTAQLVDTDWQISATANDGCFWDTGGFRNNYRPALGYTSGTGFLHHFLRFPSMTFHPGSTINTCTVQLCSANNQSGTVTAQIYFDDYGNVTAAPTSFAECVSNIVLSTNYASWTVPTEALDTWYTTPSLVTALQEIVSRSDFVYGAAVMVVACSVVGCAPEKFREYWDYTESTSKSAKLTVTWSNPISKQSRIYIPNVSWLSKTLNKRREI